MGEFNFKKYLKEGKLIKEDREDEEMAAGMPPRAGSERDKRAQKNAIAKKLKDEAKHPDSKVGASIFNKYAKKIEKADKADYKKIIKAMESELISKHPNTFSGEDDIPGSFLQEASIYPSDDYITDQNAGYIIDQIYDDMMYTEFENKEDIDKFIDSIIAGINKLRDDVKKNWDENNTDPNFDPMYNSEIDYRDNLEEGRHGPGRRMDDEYDEPNYPSRYDKFNRYSSRSQDEEEEEEENIEFVKGKDYNAQNQRVLNKMDESKYNPEKERPKNREEAIAILVKYFNKDERSYNNSPTNKQTEKKWTYNKLKNYIADLHSGKTFYIKESKFDKALKKASTKLKENKEKEDERRKKSREDYMAGMKYDNKEANDSPIGKALKSSADRYFKKEEGEVKEYSYMKRRNSYGDEPGEQRFGKPGFIQFDNEEVKYTLDSRKYKTPYDEWEVGDYLDIDSSYDETYIVKDKKSGEIITNVTAVRPH